MVADGEPIPDQESKTVTAPTLVAMGDALVDALFTGESSNPLYRGATGGGTVWNVAAGVATGGHSVVAVGARGDDWRGELAAASLDGLGVVVRWRTLERKLTRLICQVPDHAPRDLLDARPPFRLLGECVLCKRPTPQGRIATSSHQDPLPDGPGILLVDRLTKVRLEAAGNARSRDWLTVADVGRMDFVRYLSPTVLLSHLQAFDLLVMPERIARAVAKKLGVGSPDELGSAGVKALLISTLAERGAQVIDLRSDDVVRKTEVSASSGGPIVDDVGAGDALLAKTIDLMLTDGRTSPRALTLEAVTGALEVAQDSARSALAGVGARSHLASAASPVPHGWNGQPLSVLQELLQPDRPCPLCDAGRRRDRSVDRPTVGGRRNVSLLGQRVAAAISHSSALEGMSRALAVPGPSVFVGSGGSFPAALAGSMAMNRHGLGSAIAMRPLEYLQLRPAAQQVVAITYSGRNADIVQVAEAASELGVGSIALVTGATELAWAEERSAVWVISYGGAARAERGFVSIAATVQPTAVVAASVLGPQEVLRLPAFSEDVSADMADAAALISQAEPPAVIEVIGSGWAMPAMLDIESKLTESALGVARIHEAKDFSHGRFLSVLGRPVRPRVLFLGAGKRSTYEEHLLEVLGTHALVVEVRSEVPGLLGCVDLLAHCQSLTEQAARQLGRDISRPQSIPPDGLQLYSWDDSLDD